MPLVLVPPYRKSILAALIRYAKFDAVSAPGDVVLSNSFLTAQTSSTGLYGARSDVGVTTGKFYFEIKINSISNGARIGVGPNDAHLLDSGYPHAKAVAYYHTGEIMVGGSYADTVATYGLNDVIGFALDRTAKTIRFYRNGAPQGVARTIANITTDEIYAYVTDNARGGVGSIFTANFGDTPFVYTVPSGFTSGLIPPRVTFNSLDKSPDVTLSTDYLIATTPAPVKSWYRSVRATKALPSTGKFVWEVTSSILSGGQTIYPISIAQSSSALDKCFGYDAANAYGFPSVAANSVGVFTMLVDMDNRTMTAYRNGVLIGSIFAGPVNGAAVSNFPAGVYYPGASLYNQDTFEINFGQKPFVHSSIIPANYLPLDPQ